MIIPNSWMLALKYYSHGKKSEITEEMADSKYKTSLNHLHIPDSTEPSKFVKVMSGRLRSSRLPLVKDGTISVLVKIKFQWIETHQIYLIPKS